MVIVNTLPRSTPFDRLFWWYSLEPVGKLRELGCFLFRVKEGHFTPGTWLEFGSILRDHQR